MKRLLALVIFLALVWFWGCDVLERDDADVTRVTLDLSMLNGPESEVVLGGCATSIESVVLTVNSRDFRKDVSSDTVVFEVSGLRQGIVRAQAAVLSTTGDTLFVGEDRRAADGPEFGPVTIHLEKVRPVLQICPDSLELFREFDYGSTVSITNRGAQLTGTLADTLLWRAVEPRVCIGQACVVVEPDSGIVIAPGSNPVRVAGNFAPPEAIFEIPFESRFGRTKIYVRIVG